MRLSDVVSGTGTAALAEIALVLFVLAFGLIIWTAFRRGSAAVHERVSRLPLGDDDEGLRQEGGR